jgi:hypothetical protein
MYVHMKMMHPINVQSNKNNFVLKSHNRRLESHAHNP